MPGREICLASPENRGNDRMIEEQDCFLTPTRPSAGSLKRKNGDFILRDDRLVHAVYVVLQIVCGAVFLSTHSLVASSTEKE